MKTFSRFPIAVPVLLLAGSLACGKEKKTAEAATATQDTMLLRDLAEANKNTAAANAVDNSLNTVRTSGDSSLPAMVNAAARSHTPETQVVPQPPSLVKPRSSDSTPGATRARQSTGTSSRQSANSGDPCDSPAPVDQRSCLNRSIVVNDADLNRTYQDLLVQSQKSGGPDLEERLRQSQREWVNTRETECQSSGQGALWARARARCLADHSAKRTAELQHTLNSLRGQ
jgi:uncharacterized protein YecT (DUF1311 family)